MEKDRLAAFSDGVFAIIITIMVLELKAPHDASLAALAELWPVFLSYMLSFIYVAIYWNNHHHMIHTVERVNGGLLWANMHLLFWLSLIPFATAWTGENHFGQWPTVLYGFALLMPAIAYWVLQKTIILAQGRKSMLGSALGRDIKGKISPMLYLLAMALAFIDPILSNVIYVIVAGMWLIPDKRIEKRVEKKAAQDAA